ncbi:MAG: hypothetical protein ACFFBE_01150 [Promethearchaeota archaeon]
MSKEDSVVKIVIEDLIARYKDEIIAIYGIGSYFDEEIPPSWEKKDVDIIIIVKSLKSFPKVDWTEVKFQRRRIEGKEIWIGFNTLEGYQSKELFNSQSFSNYEWSVLDIKYPQNSVLLFGYDIRDQLPEVKNFKFDFDDILARGLYHLDKCLGERNQKTAKKEFSKGVFKIGFYLCKYFNSDFRDTRILRIGEKLKETSKYVKEIKDILSYFEETIIFRTTGYYITKFEELREEFITFIFSLLENGGLHKKMPNNELNNYLKSSFSGFPHLIHMLTLYRSKESQKSNIKTIAGNKELQNVNIIAKVKEIYKGHTFERADGSFGTFSSFILEDQTGDVRVVIWNDRIGKRLLKDANFTKNATVEIINGYIKTGYKDKVEVHIGSYGNVRVLEIFSPRRILIKDITKSKIKERLSVLNIKESKVTKTPCHHCGVLCSPSAKRCHKCGEPLIFKF